MSSLHLVRSALFRRTAPTAFRHLTPVRLLATSKDQTVPQSGTPSFQSVNPPPPIPRTEPPPPATAQSVRASKVPPGSPPPPGGSNGHPRPDDSPYKRGPRRLPRGVPPLLPLLALLAFSLSTWSIFLAYAANRERLASSVVRELLRQVKNHPRAREALGKKIEVEGGQWWLMGGIGGEGWVGGSLNMMQGKVDISMRVKGEHGSGTIYFTSIRRSKLEPFHIIRFKLITDSGEEINLISDLTESDLAAAHEEDRKKAEKQ